MTAFVIWLLPRGVEANESDELSVMAKSPLPCQPEVVRQYPAR